MGDFRVSRPIPFYQAKMQLGKIRPLPHQSITTTIINIIIIVFFRKPCGEPPLSERRDRAIGTALPRTLSWAGCSPAAARWPQPSPSFSRPGAVPSGSSPVSPTPVLLSRPREDRGRFVRAKALGSITVRWDQMAWSIPREKRAGARAELCTQIPPVWAAPSPALLPPSPAFFFYLQISLGGDEK